MSIGTYISIITLNENGSNISIKRHRLAEWIQKPQGTHFRPKDTYRLKVRGWKNIFHANGNQKKVGCLIFLICCWILFVRILLRIFASTFISDIGL